MTSLPAGARIWVAAGITDLAARLHGLERDRANGARAGCL